MLFELVRRMFDRQISSLVDKSHTLGVYDERAKAHTTKSKIRHLTHPVGKLYIAIGPNTVDVVVLREYVEPDSAHTSPVYSRSVLTGDESIDFRILIPYSADMIRSLSLLTHRERCDIIQASRTGLLANHVDRNTVVYMDATEINSKVDWYMNTI